MPRTLPFLALVFSVVLLACMEVEPPAARTPEGASPAIIPSPRAVLRPPPFATPQAAASPISGVSCIGASPSTAPTAASSRAATPAVTQAVSPTVVNPRLPSPPVVQTPQPVAALPLRPDVALEQQLRRLLGGDIEGFGLVAMDLKTGRGVSINGDAVFYSASVFKIWVMYEVFHQEHLGLLSLADEYVLTPYYNEFGLGPRATELCGRYTVLQLLEAMMSISDNAAAVLLQDLVGAPNINNSLNALGLAHSRLTVEGDLPITAADTALLLQIIGSGKAVGLDASEQMASLMVMETFDNGLVRGLPEGTVAAHKTGNWPTARHDVGIVFTEESTYVVVILSDNRDGSYGLIRELSAAVYEALTR